MRRTRLILVVATGLAAMTGAQPASAAQHWPPQVTAVKQAQCPAALDPPLRALDRIRAALPTLVRRLFGYRVNPNGTSYRDWQVIAAISLQPGYVPSPVPGATHWRAVAAAHCGAQVADSSWLIVLQFPKMHAINSIARFLIALTPHGWHIWASA